MSVKPEQAQLRTAFRNDQYVSAKLLATSVPSHGVELTGPIREDITWQGKASEGFAIDGFLIDWDARTVICPQGHRSVRWKPHQQRPGYWQSDVFFARHDRAACPVRSNAPARRPSPADPPLARNTKRPAPGARRLQETDQWRRH
ncbi:hypothetical protein [Streptomyces sp. NPDC001404]|uniref:hypothetical protein n=1 Tax=Streptomyces sp. NPDC001404 TaxID=3364571 RepID=UPI0036BE5E3F